MLSPTPRATYSPPAVRSRFTAEYTRLEDDHQLSSPRTKLSDLSPQSGPLSTPPHARAFDVDYLEAAASPFESIVERGDSVSLQESSLDGIQHSTLEEALNFAIQMNAAALEPMPAENRIISKRRKRSPITKVQSHSPQATLNERDEVDRERLPPKITGVKIKIGPPRRRAKAVSGAPTASSQARYERRDPHKSDVIPSHAQAKYKARDSHAKDVGQKGTVTQVVEPKSKRRKVWQENSDFLPSKTTVMGATGPVHHLRRTAGQVDVETQAVIPDHIEIQESAPLSRLYKVDPPRLDLLPPLASQAQFDRSTREEVALTSRLPSVTSIEPRRVSSHPDSPPVPFQSQVSDSPLSPIASTSMSSPLSSSHPPSPPKTPMLSVDALPLSSVRTPTTPGDVSLKRKRSTDRTGTLKTSDGLEVEGKKSPDSKRSRRLSFTKELLRTSEMAYPPGNQFLPSDGVYPASPSSRPFFFGTPTYDLPYTYAEDWEDETGSVPRADSESLYGIVHIALFSPFPPLEAIIISTRHEREAAAERAVDRMQAEFIKLQPPPFPEGNPSQVRALEGFQWFHGPDTVKEQPTSEAYSANEETGKRQSVTNGTNDQLPESSGSTIIPSPNLYASEQSN
jgi:hypothetical protein